uniref:Uncharacterized protein n=1 Tax=Arundo donax TaxID=35708 RepID=A0A0A8Y074_ARUDO
MVRGQRLPARRRRRRAPEGSAWHGTARQVPSKTCRRRQH